MNWLGEHGWEAWLIAAGLLGLLELVSLNLIFIMLAGGALVGSAATLAGAPGVLAAFLALVTAVGLLAVLRPGVIKRLHAGPSLRTGTDALIGTRARVLREIASGEAGRVKIGGEEWYALPYDEDDRIESGATVDVVQIKGATAYVLRTHSLGQGPGAVAQEG